MRPEVAFDLEVAAVVAVAVLIVAVAAAASGACDCLEEARAARATAEDVERALGDATLVAYARAGAAAVRARQRCCVFCQSEYAKADELVRVVPACGHFFHAGCGVDRWIRARRACPLCRGPLWPPRQERTPTPTPTPQPQPRPRPERDTAAVAVVVVA